MNHQEIVTCNDLLAGGLAVGSLADIQGPPKEFARKLCKVHSWRVTKWARQCTFSALVGDKPVGGWPAIGTQKG